MPPGVLEPRTGGCIAAPGAKHKETGQIRPVSLSRYPGRPSTVRGCAPYPGLERGNPGLQRLVFLAGEAGHLPDRLELIAADHVEIAEDALGLCADQRVELAP